MVRQVLSKCRALLQTPTLFLLSISIVGYGQSPNKPVKETVKKSATDEYGDIDLVIANYTAEFPGGERAMLDYIAYQMPIYPMEALIGQEEGTVIVEFEISPSGTVENAIITQSVSKSLDKKALYIVNHMPTWRPAVQKGIRVRCTYTLPIEFQLPDEEDRIPLPRLNDLIK